MRAGLAFFVDDHHLLTCAHVIAACLDSAESQEDFSGKTVSCNFVTQASGRSFEAEVVLYRKALPGNSGTASDQRHSDIALLRIASAPDALPLEPLPVVLSAPQLASPVVLIGPTADEYGGLLVSHARISTDLEDGRYYVSVQGENRARPGYSGGPVAEEKIHFVVGMVQKAPRNGGNARFVSPLVMRSAVQEGLALQARVPGEEFLAGADIEHRKIMLETLAPSCDRGILALLRCGTAALREFDSSLPRQLPRQPDHPLCDQH